MNENIKIYNNHNSKDYYFQSATNLAFFHDKSNMMVREETKICNDNFAPTKVP